MPFEIVEVVEMDNKESENSKSDGDKTAEMEEAANGNIATKVDDSSEKEQVKSCAIVKYSVPKPDLMKLECNTDLNLPPSNWLSSSADSYGFQHVLYHQKGFSSFRMAHMFPDCVGCVDVVSDAENIKKLLKIPYHKGHVSMMVHRIENTLLLDDFDIYKHLLKTSQTEWEWLKKFFFENINDKTYEEDRSLYIKNRRRDVLQQKNLVSKFLYYSLGDRNVSDESNEMTETRPIPVQGPKLPDPSPAMPDDSVNHKYNRNVVWTFEDIKMLIGTDLPIFGGGTHPCISLRLRDVSKPINVLTGIDYWLDNLMSNVPEVVMCYHLNGIVQKYELVKTEDLPRLDNSDFSPKLIRDVAQSILSFLKSNATKAGHTYWLFKGKGEEVVKLYDLTSLCNEKDVENGQNPFTVPVAMLLYRVARNMKHSSDNREPGTIRMLLKNCIKLLPEEKYPEIVTSSHYMLSDLYIPADTNPEAPDLTNQVERREEPVYDDDDDNFENNDKETKVLVLDKNYYNDKFVNYYKPPPPITGSVEERCLQAIHHVALGLNCLKYFPDQKINVEDEVPMAKPFEPIPMGYSKLNAKGEKKKKKKSKKNAENNSLITKNKNKPVTPIPTWQNGNNRNNISWKDHLKTLLYEKALLVYATLSECNYLQGHFGSALRTIALLARCQQIMTSLVCNSNTLKENCLLGRAGDCCLMIIQTWGKLDSYREQLQNPTDEDLKMMEQLEQDEQFYQINIGDSNTKCVFLYDIRTTEQILLKAVECYEEALKACVTDSILGRLGNSLNETGQFYLNKAKSLPNDCIFVFEMCQKAEHYLRRGIEVFEKCNDAANIALLNSNLGHMHRILAHSNIPEQRCELTTKEKLHYNKAFEHYKKALQVLNERQSSPKIWDAVTWELSSALFNMATIMHEYPSSQLSITEVEREVIEVLQKALKYCDLDDDNPKLPLYQYRASIIHYRMGSLYHSHILKGPINLSNRKNMIQLAKINYKKASKLSFKILDAVGYLTSQMKRVGLSEHLADTSATPLNKIKHYQDCLNIVMETKDMIKLIIDKKIDVIDNEENSLIDSLNNCYGLLNLVRQRLQSILKMLCKLCSSKPNKDAAHLVDVYKDCYKLTLELTDGLEYNELLEKLYNVLKQISSKLSQFKINDSC